MLSLELCTITISNATILGTNDFSSVDTSLYSVRIIDQPGLTPKSCIMAINHAAVMVPYDFSQLLYLPGVDGRY